MEAHRRHHRLVAADTRSAVVEARPPFAGLRSSPDWRYYYCSSLDSRESMGELQLEAVAG